MLLVVGIIDIKQYIVPGAHALLILAHLAMYIAHATGTHISEEPRRKPGLLTSEFTEQTVRS